MDFLCSFFLPDSSLQIEASTTSCDASKRAKILKPPAAAPKGLPAKVQRVGESGSCLTFNRLCGLVTAAGHTRIPKSSL